MHVLTPIVLAEQQMLLSTENNVQGFHRSEGSRAQPSVLQAGASHVRMYKHTWNCFIRAKTIKLSSPYNLSTYFWFASNYIRSAAN